MESYWPSLFSLAFSHGSHDEHLFLRNAAAAAVATLCENKDQEKTLLPPLKSAYFHIRKTKSLSLHVKVMHWLHQHVSSSVCWQSLSMMSFPEHSCLSSPWKLYTCWYTSWPSFFFFFKRSGHCRWNLIKLPNNLNPSGRIIKTCCRQPSCDRKQWAENTYDFLEWAITKRHEKSTNWTQRHLLVMSSADRGLWH